MAKKKPASTKPAKKSAAKKPAPAAKLAKAAPKSNGSVKPAAKSKTKTKKPAAEKTARAPKASLFEPKRIIKSSDDNQLHLLFKSDFECRQMFEYLRVHTTEELVTMAPHEIIERLSVPYRVAVERMRSRLADIGACLAGDESFLRHHVEKRLAQASPRK